MKMADTLTIDKEKVLAAALRCPTAKEVLKVLFPTAFEAPEEEDPIVAMIGDKFKEIWLNGPYLLTAIGPGLVLLVNISSGHYGGQAVEVGSPRGIRKSEFRRLLHCHSERIDEILATKYR